MTGRPHDPQRSVSPAEPDDPTRIFDGAFRIVVVLAAALAVLMVVRVLGDAMGPGSSADRTGAGNGAPLGSASAVPGSSADPASFLVADVRAAPPLDLTGSDGQPMSLAAMRGSPVLVFFGYTHCPDVCPATIARVGAAIDASGADARAVFVSVDPDRDTIPWLAEFVRYMPAGFSGVTGTPAQVRATADDWGVRYARVEEADPSAYSMSHTADVFLVDADGLLRASFPFGTEAPAMTEVLRLVAANPIAPRLTPSSSPAPIESPPPSAAPSQGASATPAGTIWPQVVSSSVWAGGSSPVILALFDETGGRIGDPDLTVTAQVLDATGAPVGPVVDAVDVQPVGVPEVSFVPTVDLPSPGRWQLAVEATAKDGSLRRGVVDVTALDPGSTAALGARAPSVRSPTAADFDGDLTWVSTDPLPDPRLSSTSTVDALASGSSFVLVVDSVQFRVTPVCGRAVVMAKQLLDRWRTVPFVHHEPYRYTVITTEPVLEGTLQDPRLTDVAEAWGVGSAPWGVASMPWIFVVDGDGLVRAKYQGVMGTADVDVLLSLLAQEG